MAQVEAVLFDADGVLQRRPPGWRATLRTLIEPDADPDRFLADIFAAEVPALCGGRDFRAGLAEVGRRWRCGASLSHLLEVWTMIDVDPGVAEIIQGLREAGTPCHLATNQEACKARYMSDELGYRRLFDREFYSCRLGVAKPAPAFLEAILESIATDPRGVLFIDDRPDNVAAAREAGLQGLHFSLDRGAPELRRCLGAMGLHPAPSREARLP